MNAPGQADDRAEARAAFKKARADVKAAAKALGLLVHVSTRSPMKTRRRIGRGRTRMTAAEVRTQRERRAYWEWQEAFKQAVDMLLRKNFAPEKLARAAEKLAVELVKINAKHRPKDVES